MWHWLLRTEAERSSMSNLTCADSIYPDNLPSGYDAYLGYVDGAWPTAALLPAKFPGHHILTITVRGGSTVADGCDVEAGDLTPAHGAQWAQHRIAAGAHRPVIYASASAMSQVLSELAAVKVPRSSVRLLSAHYGHGEHICGPSTCRLVSVAMDGTQWTDQAPGSRGTRIDVSLLAADFFGTAPQPAPKPAPAPAPLEDDMAVEIPPGSKSPDVGVSFNGAPYTTVGFLADPSRVGTAQTAVRCAFHNGKGAVFAVVTATMTKASPKVVVKVPANADGVSFHRLDDAPITLYPNFA
jgi:hypothetical protein